MVDSGPLPKGHIHLLMGLALILPRFVMMWYMASLLMTGSLARMMDSLFWVKLQAINVGKSLVLSKLELSANAFRFLFASSFVMRV